MRQGFPVWERPRQCNSKVVISSTSSYTTSLTRVPTGPSHILLTQNLSYADMWPTWSYKNNIMLLLDRTLQGSFAQREWKVFDGKANIFIHFKCQSQISWLSKLCKLNVREGLQEKLWISASSGVLMNKPALPIPSSSAHPSLMISALSTLLPVSYTRACMHTHTHQPKGLPRRW